MQVAGKDAIDGHAVTAVSQTNAAPHLKHRIDISRSHDLSTDVLAGVDYLVTTGVADPGRLGIGGWSYGGLLTDYVIASDKGLRPRSVALEVRIISRSMATISTPISTTASSGRHGKIWTSGSSSLTRFSKLTGRIWKPGFCSIAVDRDCGSFLTPTLQVTRNYRTFEFLDHSVSSEGWRVQWEVDPPG